MLPIPVLGTKSGSAAQAFTFYIPCDVTSRVAARKGIEIIVNYIFGPFRWKSASSIELEHRFEFVPVLDDMATAFHVFKRVRVDHLFFFDEKYHRLF